MEYRPFKNSDPPRIVELWNSIGTGRGVASGITSDAFEHVNFSQLYFERQGLIVACADSRIVGFILTGFGCNAEKSALDRQIGVICGIAVATDYRGQGIGRELLRRGEEHLRSAGATRLLAGAAPPNDPFFVGLYGGIEPAGFLDSDPEITAFFRSQGYTPHERHCIFQRDITAVADPVNVQLLTIRRKTQLAVYQGPLRKPWWWHARFGKLDSVRFVLVSKDGNQPYASATVVGLDFYLPKWEQRAVGLIDLEVAADYRRLGYGQALIAEVCRRLRQEMITLVEAHANAKDEMKRAMYEAAGLSEVDAGTVLIKAT